MFNLFSRSKVVDPALGELVRSRGFWRGAISLDPLTNVPLAVTGGGASPEPAALAAAKRLLAHFPAWRADIAQALYEHYLPYSEAIAAGEISSLGETFDKLASPTDLWPHVRLSFVSVAPLDGLLTVEIGMRVDWDEEHILGARFQEGKFIELCGSTVAP